MASGPAKIFDWTTETPGSPLQAPVDPSFDVQRETA